MTFLSKPFFFLRQECLVNWQHRAEVLQPIGLFLLVALLFPLAIGPEAHQLRSIAPGIIWVGVMLTLLLAADSLFREDFFYGTVEQWLLSSESLAFLLFLKVAVRWFFLLIPLELAAYCVGLSFHLSQEALGVLALSLVLGTPVLILLGAMGSALITALQQTNFLLGIIVIPLYIPVLIFAAGAVSQADAGINVLGLLALLAAICLVAIVLLPLAIAAALRIGVSV